MSTASPESDLRAKLARIEPALNVAAVVIMATVYLYWNLSRAIYVLLALAALVFVARYRPRMPVDHRLYSWPIIAFVGANFVSVAANGLSDAGLNRLVSRYFLLLIAIPLVSVFYLGYDSRRNPWIKFAAGCVVLGGLAIVDILYLDMKRAGSGYNASAFGFFALVLTSIVLASYHRFKRDRFGIPIFILAVSMGVCAIILSGTRTSWLAGIVVLVCAMLFYLDRYSVTRRLLVTLVVIVGITVVGSSIPLVNKRIEIMMDSVAPYVAGEELNHYNGFRSRVELWKLGWEMGMDHKLFGFGPGGTKNAIQYYAKQNLKIERRKNWNHIHNQFLQSFAMSGIFGLLSFLVLMACHFWIFARYLGKGYSMEVRSLALAGFLLWVAYLIKSIPGVPFYGTHYLMMYGFSSAAIWGSLLGALHFSAPEDRQPAP